MPADALDAAPLAADRVTSRWATLEHAEVAERKIVFHRIAWIDARQRTRDVLGGFPRSVLAVGEAEVVAELVNVRVHRDEQARRVNRPEPEVHAVGGSDHPAEEK